MTKPTSSLAGVLKGETTVPQPGMPSTNAESQSISVTLASTVPQNQSSLTTHNSPVKQNLTHAKIISAFAAKLGALVEWRSIELGDGRTGWALFFDEKKWLVDPVSKELTPL